MEDSSVGAAVTYITAQPKARDRAGVAWHSRSLQLKSSVKAWIGLLLTGTLQKKAETMGLHQVAICKEPTTAIPT